MQKYKYISSSSEIMHGALVITGTRVPIVRILYMLSEGYSVDEIHDHYPWVSKKIFKGAIAELANKIDTKEDDKEILQAQNSVR